ncbi:MAG TPA: hypothetical protein VF703_00115 [Pyrinomonadaceae bacterium]|jgi:hypothetical protein
MSYLICFGIVVAAGCGLTFLSNGFADAISRMLEAGFDFAEYRLALRERERRNMRQDARMANVVTPFRVGEVALPVNKRSTQQLGVARVAA